MIFDFLKKQKAVWKKKKVTKILIENLKIPDIQKEILLEALNSLNWPWINKMFDQLTEFIKALELKELDDISKSNYVDITWMQKKEALEKQKDLNAFSYLINNV